VALSPTAAVSTAPPARADRVEEIVTPGGVRAYLLREPALPFLSLAVHFRGGAAADPAGRPGLAHLVAGLLDEGAGPYDSQAFRRELEDHAIRVSFDADRDGVTGEMKTLTAHRERAFELLRLAVTSPRFDEEPVGRARAQVLADLRRKEADPDYLASRRWFAEAFPDHPYGHPTRARPRAWTRSGPTTSAPSRPPASAATTSSSAWRATSPRRSCPRVSTRCSGRCPSAPSGRRCRRWPRGPAGRR
jgi:zinc protease